MSGPAAKVTRFSGAAREFACQEATARPWLRKKEEALLRRVLTLWFVSRAQAARLWKAVFVTDKVAHGLAIHPKSDS